MTASTRYATPIALMALVALVPVVIHSYAGLEVDDCRNAPQFVPDNPENETDERRVRFMRAFLRAADWREGQVKSRSGAAALRFAIVRSYDAKYMYYRPAHALSRGSEPSGRELVVQEIDGVRLPIFETNFIRARATEPLRRAFHMLVYEGELVEDPYRAQLLAAPRLVFLGRRPMTLLYVDFAAQPDEIEASEAAARGWLLSAWYDYQALCK